MEYIRNVVLFLTAVATAMGIYGKITNSLPLEYVKIKYNNVPGKKITSSSLLSGIAAVTIAADFLFIVVSIGMSIYQYGFWGSFSNAFQVSSTEEIGIIPILMAIFILANLFSITIVPLYLLFNYSEQFNLKLRDCKKHKIIKHGLLFYVITLCSDAIFFVIGIYLLLSSVTNASGDIDYSNIKVGIIIIGISFTSFMIVDSLREMGNAVNSNYKYYIYLNNDIIICSLYLEIDDYYCIFRDGIETYIKKGEVKKIEKRYQDV